MTLGGFCNRALPESMKVSKMTYAQWLWKFRSGQDLRKANGSLHRRDDGSGAYVKITEALKSGDEVLIRYGSGFRM